ncbi:MAG: hypothetical protein R3F30_04125 [Planctomycetota bacterium]
MRTATTALLLLAACASGTEIPEGEGPGLTSWDREPPAGAETFDRPVWTVGDRFVYDKGGRQTLDIGVVKVDADGIEAVERSTGMVYRLGPDLDERARFSRKVAAERREFLPGRPWMHWPLWVGKKWSAGFLDHLPEGARMLQAHYTCDAIETVETAAGSFRALRIWEELELVGQDYLERTSVHWYAPEVGWFVRRLDGGTLVLLEEFERQQSGTRPTEDPAGR